jgi:single-stranded-DNA-specific exonuclease
MQSLSKQATIIRRRPPADGDQLPAELHPVLRRVLAQRGIAGAVELDQRLTRLLPFQLLGGAEPAAQLLEHHLRRGSRILVVGDFDADGATSCAVAVLGLRALGAAWVDYLVPNRFEFGYGLTPEIVALAAEREPDLLITVDNGISSVAGVAAAKARGIEVLVTDHHLAGAELPQADVLVNPNLAGDGFPSKALAGVGVIFYVLLALRARLRSTGWFAERDMAEPNLADLLDLVALGTVADVVPLDANNRILVRHGLERMRAGRCRPGIRALMEVAGRDPARIRAQDLGFVVGPRLNAAGRLDDMSLGIECLLAATGEQAQALALELDRLNRARREIEDDMKREAMMLLERMPLDDTGALPWGLCLYAPEWHQGVIGILASRIREHCHRPVIAFAPGDAGQIKGSGRSIPGLHLRDALDAVAARHPGLLSKFGGHAMAAGLTLATEQLEPFRAAFEAVVRERLVEADLQPVFLSDGGLAADGLTLDLARVLADAGPWGQAFPEPLFDDRFRVVSSRMLRERHWKLVLEPEAGGPWVDAIAFNQADPAQPRLPERVHLAYRVDINEFQGNVSLQLRVEHMEAA